MLQKDLNRLAEWEKRWGMNFHPEKCSILRVHRKREPIQHDYSLKGHTLGIDTTTKYLEVNINTGLSWNTHIDIIVKKGNSTLGFPRRNLRVSSEETKAYISLVRPSLEYCSTVWNPYTKERINKIEMAQRRAARYVTKIYHNISSVSSMIDHLGWETLESKTRTKAQLTMLSKITNNLIDIPADEYLTPASGNTRSNHNKKLRQPTTSTILQHTTGTRNPTLSFHLPLYLYMEQITSNRTRNP
jgi:hypothetical protein